MDESGMLKICNENGEEKEYSILTTFEYKNKNFVIYTDYKSDDKKNIKIYSSIYNPDDESGRLEKVIEPDDVKFIQNYIKGLEEDLKAGMMF